MSGLEATQAIRQQENGGRKRTCILGLTAHASREIREQCLDSGMDQILTKPVQIKDLLAAFDTGPSGMARMAMMRGFETTLPPCEKRRLPKRRLFSA